MSCAEIAKELPRARKIIRNVLISTDKVYFITGIVFI